MQTLNTTQTIARNTMIGEAAKLFVADPDAMQCYSDDNAAYLDYADEYLASIAGLVVPTDDDADAYNEFFTVFRRKVEALAK